VKSRIDPAYRDRLPHMEKRNGESFIIIEGNRPWKIKTDTTEWGPEDIERNKTGYTAEERVADQDRDGVDVEVVFSNKGLFSFGTNDPGFSLAMCRAWNDWAHEAYGDHRHRILPMAMVPTLDVEAAIGELQRVAEMGFRGITIPCKPEYGPTGMDHRNYNQPEFEPLWSAIEDTGLPVTIHVSTGRDPRAASGPGGAIINYAVHCCAASQEPVANLCASGVLERHPKMRFATIEAGIGWVPWLLEAMDEAFYKHRMWVSPDLKEPPSFYYRRQGFSSFGEDRSGLALAVEHDLVDNFMWANDYPHHEGTWPHSSAAIERTMGDLTEEQRTKILGGNAARFFGIELPAAR
jgi:predicted TIM-barrel fold metal-dependent hydrolase